MILPKSAAELCQMEVVLSRIASPKELAPGNPLLAAMRVTRILQRRDQASSLSLTMFPLLVSRTPFTISSSSGRIGRLVSASQKALRTL